MEIRQAQWTTEMSIIAIHTNNIWMIAMHVQDHPMHKGDKVSSNHPLTTGISHQVSSNHPQTTGINNQVSSNHPLIIGTSPRVTKNH